MLVGRRSRKTATLASRAGWSERGGMWRPYCVPREASHADSPVHISETRVGGGPRALAQWCPLFLFFCFLFFFSFLLRGRLPRPHRQSRERPHLLGELLNNEKQAAATRFVFGFLMPYRDGVNWSKRETVFYNGESIFIKENSYIYYYYYAVTCWPEMWKRCAILSTRKPV